MANSSSSKSKTDGDDFPFQFMLDARKSPVNWEYHPKISSMGILSPFQWSPPQSSTRPETFSGDITAFYHGPNIFQDDGSFSFFDQSFFFMDQADYQYAHRPQPRTTPPPTIPRNSQHRVSFASKLTKCRRQRMSTIAESPVNEDDSSTEEEEGGDDSNHHEVVNRFSIASQPSSWEFRSEPLPQTSVIKKLLDYVVPYPTRSVRRRAKPPNKRKATAAAVMPRTLSIKTTNSTSSSTDSECSSLGNEEWIAHGFFEIQKGL